MKILIGALVLGLVMGAVEMQLLAQGDDYLPGAFAFLEEGSSGARAAALRGAFSALSDDWTAVRWNPAGLLQLQSASLGLQTQNKFNAGIWDNFLGGVLPLKQLTLGGAVNALVVNDLLGEGKGSDLEMLYTLAAAKEIWPGLNFGLGAKFYSQQLLDASSQGFGFDAGLLWKASKVLGAALVVHDVGDSKIVWTTGEKSRVVSHIVAGIKWLPSQGIDLKILADFDYIPYYNEAVWRLGSEMGFSNIPLQLRAGMKITPGSENLGDWSVGIGWRAANFNIDVAYITYSDLPDNLMASVALAL